VLGSVLKMDVPGSRADVERYRRVDEAFRTGDMTALQRLLGSLEGFPNVVTHPAMVACLAYAIYDSPTALVGALLEAGADPNWPDADGFPPLVAALSCSAAAAGAAVRTDVHELLGMRPGPIRTRTSRMGAAGRRAGRPPGHERNTGAYT
jgi:hypothetical protein